ncbi:NADAR family protein [Saccharopolyspora indica]|uniref:NADAR family protein n=1 Tax=Saccharopolyspora indica TaxID=1229659 RepID=UPI0022EB1214|nr:NADAR family protein [Saccharopolyspora indica]MDA3644361.1 NADAR family protein [Saccharopolyspora indica]
MREIATFRGEHFFLSNFYPAAVVGAERRRYPSAEAAFHGGKTLDPRERDWIAAAATPREAKRRGRRVSLRPDWDSARHLVMRAVLRGKFADPDLAAKLLATGETRLVEGNRWHDQLWGDCRCGRAACDEPGRNFLGIYLMELRAELRAATPRPTAPASEGVSARAA